MPLKDARLPSALPALALVGALLLSTLAFGGILRPAGANLGRPSIDSMALNMGVDPNTAQWFELAQLPGIGESLARKIVAYRDSQRAADPNSERPFFQSAGSLSPIPGIGPRTLARLRPFLRFPTRSAQFDTVTSSR
ncbi:MAG TPA: helix-hairpin-helix domain-containing protein [Phycisphaerae bacterium]|nr:helix-hairpin-helix domain-containing protein [Phycisphaerae bacterium]